MSPDPARIPPGVKTGGQFAKQPHDEGDVTLDASNVATLLRVTCRNGTMYGDDLPEDGLELSMDSSSRWYDPSDKAKVTRSADGGYVVDYIAPDPHGDLDWEWDEDEYVEFRNGYARDEWLDDNGHGSTADVVDDGGKLGSRSFLVERYEHGSSHYALVGESSQVDRNWDVAVGVGVINVPADVPEDNIESYARARLTSYTQYVNGEAYEVLHDEFDAEGIRLEGRCDAVGGYLGEDHALSSLGDR